MFKIDPKVTTEIKPHDLVEVAGKTEAFFVALTGMNLMFRECYFYGDERIQFFLYAAWEQQPDGSARIAIHHATTLRMEGPRPKLAAGDLERLEANLTQLFTERRYSPGDSADDRALGSACAGGVGAKPRGSKPDATVYRTPVHTSQTTRRPVSIQDCRFHWGRPHRPRDASPDYLVELGAMTWRYREPTPFCHSRMNSFGTTSWARASAGNAGVSALTALRSALHAVRKKQIICRHRRLLG